MSKKLFYIIVEIILAAILAFLLFRLAKVNAAEDKKYIAIIIDDFGNGSKGTEEMLDLPIKFTGAVMPSMPYSQDEQDRLIACGKEAILHQPMEAHTGKRSWLGPVPILSAMSTEEAKNVFAENLASLDKVKGFNNHMGSAITEDKDKMRAILTYAKDKGIFFVDSVTTGKSAAEEIAKEISLPYIKRDVFLDSTQDISKITENMNKTGKIALERGYAVAIGHVGAEGGVVTAQAIKNTCKGLENKGIEFVTVSELMEKLELLHK